VLTKFYGVSATMAPLYLLAFAVGNRAGPLILGRLYDNVGRKPMISGTYWCPAPCSWSAATCSTRVC
jgi:MFS family permease